MSLASSSAPLLEAQIAELRSSSIGATIQTKSSAFPGGPIDRYIIRIPYCKASLKWRLLFNRDQPQLAPDFMLGRGEEGLVELSALKSLKNWDIRQPRSLVEIVSEFMQCYKETQKRAVLAYPSERIHFELSLIQDRPGTEFLLLQSSEHGAEIRVVLPLEVPEAWNPSLRADSKICLFVAWRPNIKATATTSLVTNAHFDNILGEVQLPAWRDEMCLMDYVPAVEAVIKEGIADYAYRKAFTQQCLISLGSCAIRLKCYSPLEYDSIGFRKITYMLGDEAKPKKDEKDVLMIAIISLPLNFQKDKPSIVLQSVVPGKGGKPIARAATNFPWVSRSPAEEAIKKLRGYFADVRMDFAAVVEAELKQLTE